MKYVFSEWQDALVRKIYATQSYSERRKLYKTLFPLIGYPKHIVYYRACTLGIIQPVKKPDPWSEAENDLLEEHGHKTAPAIGRILRGHGYIRSDAAIIVQRTRLLAGYRQSKIDAGVYTATQAGEILGVSSRTVSHWIEKGWLTAKRGVIHGPTVAWEIKASDLKSFIIHHTARVDFTRADKYMLVDILCPQHGAKIREKEAA